jgi:hypothetical protein
VTCSCAPRRGGTKDGTAVRYLQLVHNEWDPATKSAKMRVLHNFGREDQVDKAAIERLAGSLFRLLDPGRAAALQEPGLSLPGLGRLRRAVAAGPVVAAAGHRRDPGRPAHDDPPRRLGRAGAVRPGRHRAPDPSSKLAAAHWAGRKAWIDRLPETTDDACYRAMDWLHQVRAAVEKEIYCQTANLLNLEAGLLFFDTTSTYFEVDEADEPVPRDKNGNVTDDEQQAAEGKSAGFRAFGKFKDHRDHLPQIVIGMAVTRDASRCGPGAGRGTRTTRR